METAGINGVALISNNGGYISERNLPFSENCDLTRVTQLIGRMQHCECMILPLNIVQASRPGHPGPLLNLTNYYRQEDSSWIACARWARATSLLVRGTV